MSINREADGGWTLAALVIGSVLLGVQFGFFLGAGVFLVLFAVGGEVQRKANQILDVLEGRQ